MSKFEKFSIIVGGIFAVIVLLATFGMGDGLFRSIGLSLFAPPPSNLSVACGASILNEPYLSNPTSAQVTLSLRVAKPSTMWVETSSDGGVVWNSTTIQGVPRDVRADFVLPTAPNTTYDYRVGCTNAAGGTEYWFTNSFRSLPSPGQATPIRFAYITDTHYWQQYAKAQNGNTDGLENVQRTLANLTTWNPLFVVAGGDRMMTHCASAPNCPNAVVDGENGGAGTVKTVRQAELRNRQTIRGFSSVLSHIPGIFYNGNHEGENGFIANTGVAQCGYRLNTDSLSEMGRFKYLPNAAFTFPGGDSTGNYYDFAAGPAQFAIIDVMKYQQVVPQTPQEWNIGNVQGNWLANELLSSTAPRKFVFAEHLVGGGAGGPPNCNGTYWYGRGGMLSTQDGTDLSPFLGQQEEINGLMAQAGGVIWMSGHDHLAMFGQDLDPSGAPSGNYYISGGRGGENAPAWTLDPTVVSQYDYNGNGVADYEEPNSDHASNKPGFWLIDIAADGQTTLRYIVTDADPIVNNTAVITKVVD